MGIRTLISPTTTETTHTNMFSFRRGDRSAGTVKAPSTCKDLDSPLDTETVPTKKPRNDNNNNNSSNLQALFRFLTLGKSDQKSNRRRKRRRNNRKGGSPGGALLGSTNSTVHMSGIRKSTSTHFTRSTNGGHSSAFMVYDPLVEPMTMEDFLRCEELAAFEQQQEEVGSSSHVHDQTLPTETIEQDGDFVVGAAVHCTQEELCTCAEGVASEYCTSGKPHRVPPPESYYEMTKNEHAELGNIQFEFDALEQAQEESMFRVQPILCIEAEVPGDITSGETIFSHPLIVEAAESLFVTVRPRLLEPQDEEEDQDDSHSHAIDQSASSFASLRSTTARSTKRKRLGDKRYFTNSSCRTRVRILDDKGIDVLPPTEHMTAVEVVTAMVRGLEAYHLLNSNSIIPKYLRLLLEEEAGKLQVLSKTRLREIQGTAVFGVFDAVAAEVELAALDGILSTRSGALVRQKVVQVTYDSRKLSYCALVRHALCRAGATIIYHQSNEERVVAKLEVQQFEESRAMKQKLYGNAKVCCNSTDDRDNEEKNEEGDEDNDMESIPPLPAIKLTEYFGNMRAACNPKPALRGSILRFVPLTDLQATKANRLIHLQKFNEAMHLLSPRQGLIAMQALQAHRSRDFQDVVDVPIGSAWSQLCTDAAAISELHQRAMIAGTLRCCDDDEASDSPTEDPTEEYEDPYLQ